VKSREVVAARRRLLELLDLALAEKHARLFGADLAVGFRGITPRASRRSIFARLHAHLAASSPAQWNRGPVYSTVPAPPPRRVIDMNPTLGEGAYDEGA
jgi:hypothetical protein